MQRGVGGSTFNLNTISQGISTADFYLTVPQAIVKFLASDTRTRVLAKPQLRGAEGSDLELNLGDEIPVPSTVFGGLGAGGVNTVPISSFTYRNVGVNVKMKPRVTFENEIILEIEVENSTLGNNINVAGQLLPTFGTRKVKTRMRLREGESNLIAGLVREEDRKVLQGVAGLMRIPILKDILGGTEEQINSTDIVILLTPRIVRTHELTQEHLNPIYIGSQMNLGLSGPTPTIGAEPLPAVPEPAAAAPAATAPPGSCRGTPRRPRAPSRRRPASRRPRRRHRRRRRPTRRHAQSRRHRTPAVADAGRAGAARRRRRRRHDADAAAVIAPPAAPPQRRRSPRRRRHARSASRRRARSSASAAARTRCRSPSATPRGCP